METCYQGNREDNKDGFSHIVVKVYRKSYIYII